MLFTRGCTLDNPRVKVEKACYAGNLQVSRSTLLSILSSSCGQMVIQISDMTLRPLSSSLYFLNSLSLSTPKTLLLKGGVPKKYEQSAYRVEIN